jgi:hypothetical protein
MGLRFSFPIELRIDLTSLPQGWKEEVVPFLLEQSIMYGPRARLLSPLRNLCRSLPFPFQSLRILTNVYVCQRKCLFVLYSFIFLSIEPRLLRIGKPLFLSWHLNCLN